MSQQNFSERRFDRGHKVGVFYLPDGMSTEQWTNLPGGTLVLGYEEKRQLFLAQHHVEKILDPRNHMRPDYIMSGPAGANSHIIARYEWIDENRRKSPRFVNFVFPNVGKDRDKEREFLIQVEVLMVALDQFGWLKQAMSSREELQKWLDEDDVSTTTQLGDELKGVAPEPTKVSEASPKVKSE